MLVGQVCKCDVLANILITFGLTIHVDRNLTSASCLKMLPSMTVVFPGANSLFNMICFLQQWIYGSGIVWTALWRVQGVALASKFTRSQPSLAFVGCAGLWTTSAPPHNLQDLKDLLKTPSGHLQESCKIVGWLVSLGSIQRTNITMFWLICVLLIFTYVWNFSFGVHLGQTKKV